MPENSDVKQLDVLQWAAENNIGFEISTKRGDFRVIAWKRKPGEINHSQRVSVSLNSWLLVRDTCRLGDDIIQALELLRDGMDDVHLTYIPTKPRPVGG